MVNITDLSNIRYVSECNTSRSLKALQQPIVHNNLIYTLEREYIWDDGTYNYLRIREVKNLKNNFNETKKSLYALFSILVIPTIMVPIILKRKK